MKMIVCWILALGLCMGCNPYSVTPPPVKAPVAVDIQCSIQSAQTTIFPNEPIYLNCQVRNTGKTSAWLHLKTITFFWYFEVSGPKVIAMQQPPVPGFPTDDGFIELKSGETQSFQCSLSTGTGGTYWTFAEPGTYRITMVYRLTQASLDFCKTRGLDPSNKWIGEFRSNETTITVTPMRNGLRALVTQPQDNDPLPKPFLPTASDLTELWEMTLPKSYKWLVNIDRLENNRCKFSSPDSLVFDGIYERRGDKLVAIGTHHKLVDLAWKIEDDKNLLILPTRYANEAKDTVRYTGCRLRKLSADEIQKTKILNHAQLIECARKHVDENDERRKALKYMCDNFPVETRQSRNGLYVMFIHNEIPCDGPMYAVNVLMNYDGTLVHTDAKLNHLGKTTTFTPPEKTAKPDPIDLLAQKLNADGKWSNGFYPDIFLPPEATPEAILAQALKMTGVDQGHAKTYKIIQIRQLQLNDEPTKTYSAALVESDQGTQILLFWHEGKGWLTRFFDVPQAAPSRFSSLNLKPGTPRLAVEKQVATLLDKPNVYSPYGNNLLGGVVQYRDGNWLLEITYKPGAPAPTIINANGQAQGYPPIDETVISHQIKQLP